MTRNLFKLTFFGGDDIDANDIVSFGHLIKQVWPVVSEQQIATVTSTVENFLDCEISVYHRPSREVLVIEVFHQTSEDAIFFSKIEPKRQLLLTRLTAAF